MWPISRRAAASEPARTRSRMVYTMAFCCPPSTLMEPALGLTLTALLAGMEPVISCIHSPPERYRRELELELDVCATALRPVATSRVASCRGLFMFVLFFSPSVLVQMWRAGQIALRLRTNKFVRVTLGQYFQCFANTGIGFYRIE